MLRHINYTNYGVGEVVASYLADAGVVCAGEQMSSFVEWWLCVPNSGLNPGTRERKRDELNYKLKAYRKRG